MAIESLVLTVVALIVIAIFSIRAVQVEQSLWRSCRGRCNCLRLQRQITLGMSHCR